MQAVRISGKSFLRLARPVLGQNNVRFAGILKPGPSYTWPSLFKKTADHGPELLALVMYFCCTSR